MKLGTYIILQNLQILQNLYNSVNDISIFIFSFTGFEGKKPHYTLFKWAMKHGDIFRLKVLGENIIVLNGADHIREANTGT